MPDKLGTMGRPKKPEPSDPLRMPRSFVKRVKMIALHKGVDPGDYLAGLLSKAIDEDERAMLKDIAQKRTGK